MASIDNTFLRGKMNKDIDDRLMPSGEYRDALNINVGKSEGSDVGAAENILGNRIPYTPNLEGLQGESVCIGSIVDSKKERIFWFVAGVENPTRSNIYMYDQVGGYTKVLASGGFLNFSPDHLITGISILEDLLYWTDNYNQPRRLNIETALEAGELEYKTEEHINALRFAPYKSISFLDTADVLTTARDTGVNSTYLEREFPRFAYRFKFVDNEYSVLSPFSQVCFQPYDPVAYTDGAGPTNVIDPTLVGDIVTTTEMPLMRNWVNQVGLRVELPSAELYKDYGIEKLEFVIKLAGDQDVKIIKEVDVRKASFISEVNTLNSNSYTYTYNSEPPYKVLPSKQLTRVFDDSPRAAQALEIASNRVMYGNYLKGYDLPELDYEVRFASKPVPLMTEFPNYSVKSDRTYKVGVVLADKFGRQSPVILSENSTITLPKLDDNTTIWEGNCLVAEFNKAIPNAYNYTENIVPYGATSAVRFNDGITFTSLYIYGWIAPSDQESFKVGDRLAAIGGGYTTITNVIEDTVNNITKIYCDEGISSDYEFDLSDPWNYPDPIPMLVLRTNLAGWYSYNIVVQQQEQEYYNVYAPTIRYDTDASWVVLHGDNINKMPRETTSDKVGSGVSPSDILVEPILTSTDTVSYAAVSYVDKEKRLGIISIGTAKEHGLDPDSADKTWIYQPEKNHLMAELSLDNLLGLYKSHTIPSPQETFSVLETEPFESVLDIFWETSSSGLVFDLNTAVATGVGAPYLITTNKFSEDQAEDTLISKLGPVDPAISFRLDNVSYSNNTVNQNNFEVVYNAVDGDWELRLVTNPYYFSYTDVKNYLVATITAEHISGTETTAELLLAIENATPTMEVIGDPEPNDPNKALMGWGNIFFRAPGVPNGKLDDLTAANGSLSGGTEGLRYSFVQNPGGFALDPITGRLSVGPYASFSENSSNTFTLGVYDETPVNDAKLIKIKVTDASAASAHAESKSFERTATVTVLPPLPGGGTGGSTSYDTYWKVLYEGDTGGGGGLVEYHKPGEELIAPSEIVGGNGGLDVHEFVFVCAESRPIIVTGQWQITDDGPCQVVLP